MRNKNSRMPHPKIRLRPIQGESRGSMAVSGQELFALKRGWSLLRARPHGGHCQPDGRGSPPAQFNQQRNCSSQLPRSMARKIKQSGGICNQGSGAETPKPLLRPFAMPAVKLLQFALQALSRPSAGSNGGRVLRKRVSLLVGRQSKLTTLLENNNCQDGL